MCVRGVHEPTRVEIGNSILLSICISLSLALAWLPLARAQTGPDIATWADDPANYKQLDYPLVFITSYRNLDTKFVGDPPTEVLEYRNGGAFGNDVVEALTPDRGGELWILLPMTGEAKRIFPIVGVHDDSITYPNDAVDYPIGGGGNNPINGAVTEPSISIDGRRAYFTYFHRADREQCACSSSNYESQILGSDIYSIDLGPIIDNNSFPPGLLPFKRLTRTTNKYVDAMNPGDAQGPLSVNYALNHLSPVEVDTQFGRKLMYTSDLRLLLNSNPPAMKRNTNINLFTADFDFSADPILTNRKQFQYYTTTSALSPTRMASGVAFSYQATTEDARSWMIQTLDSEGRWSPAYGYGILDQLAHLQTFCRKTTNSGGGYDPGDYIVVDRYYNQNNNGFGTLWAQDSENLGLNRYDVPNSDAFGVDMLHSYHITLGVTSADLPDSDGKFTTPACARPDELFAAYDPDIGNHKNQEHPYNDVYIVFTTLDPAHPTTQPSAYEKVAEAVGPDAENWALIWPKPVIPWDERLGEDHGGDPQQTPSMPVIDPTTPIGAGQPYGIIGTSALYNTDVTPAECRITDNGDTGGDKTLYHPYINNNAVFQALDNIDMLTRTKVHGSGNPTNQTGSCTPPVEEDVFGIAIYLTSNKTNRNADVSGYSPEQGYFTDGYGGSVKESKRLLGVFQAGDMDPSQTDFSFEALIPANAPVDFHLVDSVTGHKLADVRSWHSLKPRETRNDCGGCHNHRPGAGIPFATSEQGINQWDPYDMVDSNDIYRLQHLLRPRAKKRSE